LEGARQNKFWNLIRAFLIMGIINRAVTYFNAFNSHLNFIPTPTRTSQYLYCTIKLLMNTYFMKTFVLAFLNCKIV